MESVNIEILKYSIDMIKESYKKSFIKKSYIFSYYLKFINNNVTQILNEFPISNYYYTNKFIKTPDFTYCFNFNNGFKGYISSNIYDYYVLDHSNPYPETILNLNMNQSIWNLIIVSLFNNSNYIYEFINNYFDLSCNDIKVFKSFIDALKLLEDSECSLKYDLSINEMEFRVHDDDEVTKNIENLIYKMGVRLEEYITYNKYVNLDVIDNDFLDNLKLELSSISKEYKNFLLKRSIDQYDHIYELYSRIKSPYSLMPTYIYGYTLLDSFDKHLDILNNLYIDINNLYNIFIKNVLNNIKYDNYDILRFSRFISSSSENESFVKITPHRFCGSYYNKININIIDNNIIDNNIIKNCNIVKQYSLYEFDEIMTKCNQYNILLSEIDNHIKPKND